MGAPSSRSVVTGSRLNGLAHANTVHRHCVVAYRATGSRSMLSSDPLINEASFWHLPCADEESCPAWTDRPTPTVCTAAASWRAPLPKVDALVRSDDRRSSLLALAPCRDVGPICEKAVETKAFFAKALSPSVPPCSSTVRVIFNPAVLVLIGYLMVLCFYGRSSPSANPSMQFRVHYRPCRLRGADLLPSCSSELSILRTIGRRRRVEKLPFA